MSGNTGDHKIHQFDSGTRSILEYAIGAGPAQFIDLMDANASTAVTM